MLSSRSIVRHLQLVAKSKLSSTIKVRSWFLATKLVSITAILVFDYYQSVGNSYQYQKLINILYSQKFTLTPLAPIPLYYAFSLIGSSDKKTSSQQVKKMTEALQNADQLMDESRYQECFEFLQSQTVNQEAIALNTICKSNCNLFQDQSDPEILWRKARSMQKLAKTTVDKKQREDYIRKAFAFVEEALQKDENNFAIHKWYAILLDSRAELDGIKARVSECENVRRHMIRATELKPDDPTSWYILGELEYSLADMSWYVQKIVSALFATPPSGSFEKALECFKKAEGLEPNFYSKNNLMMAKTYMQLKNNDKAKEQLNMVVNIKVA